MILAQLKRRQSSLYWLHVRIRALELESDGCSGPARLTQAFREACLEHDVFYRTGKMLDEDPISRIDADAVLAVRIRQMTWDRLGWRPWTWINLVGYPMSVWRWLAVRLGGASSYKGASPNTHTERLTMSGGEEAP